MTHLRIRVLVIMCILAVAGLGCGNPKSQPIDFLEVMAFLPSDGAANVATTIKPWAIFTSEVDQASLENSVYMGQNPLAWDELNGRWICGADYTNEVTGYAEVDGTTVTFNPGTRESPQELALETCYCLTFKTTLRGVNQGPLKDMGLQNQPGIGALQRFSTKPE